MRGRAIAPYRPQMNGSASAWSVFLRVVCASASILLAGSGFAAKPPDVAGETGAEAALFLAAATGGEATEAAPEAGLPEESIDQSLPTILRSESDLPEPVRAMRQKLIDAAKSGDIERLRPLMEAQPEPPSVAFGNPGDPIEYLKALAADADGREILAILLEVLQSGFVHVGEGTDEDHFVWPYFAQYPLNALTPEQLVELFTLLTAADYEDMKSYGAYTFFRVGIAPDGRWLFFLAGD